VAGSNYIALRSDENAVSQMRMRSPARQVMKEEIRCGFQLELNVLPFYERVYLQRLVLMKLDINVSLSFYLTAFWMAKKHNLTIINVYPFSTERCSH